MSTERNTSLSQAGAKDLFAQLRQKEQEQSLLLSMNSRIAAARTRDDLWSLVSHDILGAFNAKYYTLCLINEDGETHSPFLHSRERISSLTEQSPIIHAFRTGLHQWLKKVCRRSSVS
ncbi:MAG: hypothetical protein ABW007_00840 [Chitinophagaceae bacterium]